jgi:hypothetical protein
LITLYPPLIRACFEPGGARLSSPIRAIPLRLSRGNESFCFFLQKEALSVLF